MDSFPYTTANNLYAIFRNRSDGQVWSTVSSAYEPINTANYANYDVALTATGLIDVASVEVYTILPPAGLSSEVHDVLLYKRAGVGPVMAADTFITVGETGPKADAAAVASLAANAITATSIASGALTNAKFASGAIGGTVVAANAFDQILIETAISILNDSGATLTEINLRQAMALILSESAASLVITGAGVTNSFKAAGKSSPTRITATTDEDGNRTPILRVPD